MDTEHSELDKLLSKYRLTFNWRDPGLQWYLVGQLKGSNTLARSQMQPAANIETAKVDALEYIKNKFTL